MCGGHYLLLLVTSPNEVSHLSLLLNDRSPLRWLLQASECLVKVISRSYPRLSICFVTTSFHLQGSQAHRIHWSVLPAWHDQDQPSVAPSNALWCNRELWVTTTMKGEVGHSGSKFENRCSEFMTINVLLPVCQGQKNTLGQHNS